MRKKLWSESKQTKGLNTLVCASHNKETGDFDNIGYVFYNDKKVFYSFENGGRKLKSESIEEAKKVIEITFDELYNYQPPKEGEYEN